MSIFGFYFVSSMLRETGWPRKQGMLGREVIDTSIADAIAEQMTEWTAGLGAGRPALALQMIAEMFRDRDWAGDNAPQVKSFIEGAQWTDDHPPKPSFQLKTFGKTISAKDFNDKRLITGFEQSALESLLWGLGKPQRFAAWFNAKARQQAELLPAAQKAGLKIDGALPDLSQWFQFSEDILRDYERNVGALPPIPAKLLADARALGVQV